MAPLDKNALIVGFGAVGAMYSYILKRGGVHVTSVARSNYGIVDAQGMNIQSRKYGNIQGWKPDRLCNSVSSAADRSYSYVVVTTKALPDVKKTPEILSPLLSKSYLDKFSQPTYVLLQNGLNVETDLYKAVEELGQRPKIISTAVWIGTNLLSGNEVEHNDFDRVTMGMYRLDDYTTTENTPEEASILADFASRLETGGSTVTVVSEVQRVKFAKNFWNIAFSAFCTLTGHTLPSIFRAPPENGQSYAPYVHPSTADKVKEYTIPTILATMEELLALGRAMGFPDSQLGLPSSIVETTMERTRALHLVPESVHVPSMLLDARKGQPLEVEAIVGEVVRMGRQRGVAMPRVEMLYALLLVVQNQLL